MLKKIAMITLIVAFFTSCLIIIYWLVDRYKTNVRVDVVLSTHSNIVHPGETISIIRADYDEPPGCVMRIRRYLVLLPFPNRPFMFDQFEITTGENPNKDNPVYSNNLARIPETMLPGEYLYYIQGEYYCNMIDYLTGGYDFTSTPLQLTIVAKP